MTTPGKNQGKDGNRVGQNQGQMEEEEEVRAPVSNDELDDDEEEEDEALDRVPEESVDDQETGRADRDSARPGGRIR